MSPRNEPGRNGSRMAAILPARCEPRQPLFRQGCGGQARGAGAARPAPPCRLKLLRPWRFLFGYRVLEQADRFCQYLTKAILPLRSFCLHLPLTALRCRVPPCPLCFRVQVQSSMHLEDCACRAGCFASRYERARRNLKGQQPVGDRRLRHVSDDPLLALDLAASLFPSRAASRPCACAVSCLGSGDKSLSFFDSDFASAVAPCYPYFWRCHAGTASARHALCAGTVLPK